MLLAVGSKSGHIKAVPARRRSPIGQHARAAECVRSAVRPWVQQQLKVHDDRMRTAGDEILTVHVGARQNMERRQRHTAAQIKLLHVMRLGAGFSRNPRAPVMRDTIENTGSGHCWSVGRGKPFAPAPGRRGRAR